MSRKNISIGSTIFNVFNYTFLIVLSLLFLIPFVVVLSTSLVSEQELLQRGSYILFPEKVDFTAYRVLLAKGSILFNAYKITILRVVIGTFLNLVFTSMLAYGLSRKNLLGRNVLITIIFITMLFNGGLIPTYLWMKFLYLTNTFWVMILPGLISAWYFLVMKNFFSQLPEALEESALMDGATPSRILVSIIFPLSLPTFAAIGLFYAVSHWNAWFDATIYINNQDLMPIQVLLRRIVLTLTSQDLDAEVIANLDGGKPTSQSLRGAMIIVSTLPIICVYPFLQKHFVKGALIGSVKG